MNDNSQSAVNNAAQKKSTNFRNFRFPKRFNSYNRNSEPRIRPISVQISSNQVNQNTMNSPSTSNTQSNTGEPTSYQINVNQKCDYPGWKLYFPEEGLYSTT